MQYPPDGHELDPDEEALFRDYRDDIRDNICTIQLMMNAQCQSTLISTPVPCDVRLVPWAVGRGPCAVCCVLCAVGCGL